MLISLFIASRCFYADFMLPLFFILGMRFIKLRLVFSPDASGVRCPGAIHGAHAKFPADLIHGGIQLSCPFMLFIPKQGYLLVLFLRYVRKRDPKKS